MVGNKYMVAPVLHQGQRSRNIYLPRGTWRDLNTNEQLVGERWLMDYPAPLDVLPVFELLSPAGVALDRLDGITPDDSEHLKIKII